MYTNFLGLTLKQFNSKIMTTSLKPACKGHDFLFWIFEIDL